MTATVRSPESIRHHYEVEKALADRVRRSVSREERARLYGTMYDELFAAVPDHPRLTRVHDPETIAARNRGRLALVNRYLSPRARVLDIGAGDCAFSVELARRAGAVYALEISGGSASVENAPENMTLVLYDGFHLPFEPGSLDLAFSDQLVEHLHPDDQQWHFAMVAAVLVPGGVYVFRTPHRFTGPHDVSRYFTKGDPEGFHMKEWTYVELIAELRRAGFARFTVMFQKKGRAMTLPVAPVVALERLLKPLPLVLRRVFSRYPFSVIAIAAEKAS